VIKQSPSIWVFWVVVLNSRVFDSQHSEAMHNFIPKGRGRLLKEEGSTFLQNVRNKKTLAMQHNNPEDLNPQQRCGNLKSQTVL
jgi:hypothetical protein